MSIRSLTQRTWYPKSAPQTLQYAVVLLYWNAAIALVLGLIHVGAALHLLGLLAVLSIAGDVAGAYGISNEKRWGYVVALAAAAVTLALGLLGVLGLGGLFGVLFDIVLVVLLVHPMSRSYTKIWFR